MYPAFLLFLSYHADSPDNRGSYDLNKFIMQTGLDWSAVHGGDGRKQNVMGYAGFFRAHIKTLEGNIRFSFVWGIGLLCVGFFLTIALFWFGRGLELGDVGKLGPGIVLTGISLLPFKDVPATRERINVYRVLQVEHERFGVLAPEQQRRLIETTDKIIEQLSRRP